MMFIGTSASDGSEKEAAAVVPASTRYLALAGRTARGSAA
eukprot:CAMPEP_0118996094 /NCGR_PEP_ID=MMETSP1173-20130426/59490_1 /TAXON_ID=1034831 /ORGANISM="Rhizochromulina marina cf, Strain CCMP1243" /LENGTH=39 /DNA_ID= /DNA_START= /DNA_END= /DNA_ORIENTATION=